MSTTTHAPTPVTLIDDLLASLNERRPEAAAMANCLRELKARRQSDTALVSTLERIALGNRRILADRLKLTRDELVAGIDVVADLAEAALKAAKGGA